MITAVPARYRRVPAVKAVQRALLHAVTVEEARARVAQFDISAGLQWPAWHCEEYPDDEHGATLESGDVLVWRRVAPGEPLELFLRLDAYSGTVVWREKL